MSLPAYLVAAVQVGFVVGALVGPAVLVRRRFFSGWTGAPARLVEAVSGVALLVGAGQLLGALGLLTRGSVLGLAMLGVAGAGAVAVATRGRPARPGSVPPAPASSRLARVAATIAGAVLTAQWTTYVLVAIDHGTLGVDSLVYHLPAAARFAQQGRITPIHPTIPDYLTQFVPANAELLHGMAVVLINRDVLSPLLNIGWLVLALLAAACVGRRRGTGALSMVAVTAILVTPLMVVTQAGTALDDLPPLALLLSSVALIDNGEGDRRALALAAVAAGLALGSKPTVFIVVAALSVGVLLFWPNGKREVVTTWAPLAGLSAAFWYVRNLIAIGNPVPGFRFHAGPISLPNPPSYVIEHQGWTILHYATDLTIVHRYFVPGLRLAFGPGWPLLLMLVTAGIVIGFVTGDRWHRVLAAAAVLGIAEQLVTAAGAGGDPGHPILFPANLRWVIPALALGLVLVVSSPQLRQGRWQIVALSAFALTIGVQETASGTWPAFAQGHRAAGLAAAVIVVVGCGLAFAAPRRRLPLRHALAGATILVVAGLAAGYKLQAHELRGRFAGSGSPRDTAYAWANGVHGARIAVGGLVQQYPLTGIDLSNVVDYVGLRQRRDGLAEAPSCAVWRAAVNAGHYRYVVTGPVGDEVTEPPMAGWTRSDPAAVQIVHDRSVSVFRLSGPLDVAACNAS